MPGLLTSLRSWLPTREVVRDPTPDEVEAVAVKTKTGLKESIGLLHALGGVLNQFIDPTGGIYFNTNQGGGAYLGGMRDSKRFGRDRYLYWTEEQLTWFRNYCRWISKTVPFAIGLFGHLVSFTVKTGYQIEVEPKEDEDVDEGKLKAMKRRINDFKRRFEEESGGVIHWAAFEQMCKEKVHVDGELIFRLHPGPEGMRMRRVEPEQIKDPPNGNETNGWYYGVKCVPGDAFKRLGYWITREPGVFEGEYVDAEYVIHYRRNADDLTARGISDLLPVSDDLLQVDALMEAFRKGSTERAKIPYIRVHKEMTGSQIEQMAAALKDVDVVNKITGAPERAERTEPGTIVDCSDWTSVETMPAGNTDEAVNAWSACLRGLAMRWGMPEFMATSDASNANYASTMMAGGPAVRMFEREQCTDGGHYSLLYRKVLRWDALLGEFGFNEEDLEQVEIKVYGPSPVIVDELAQAQRFQIEKQEKVRSISDWQRQIGLDPEVMRAEVEEDLEAFPQDDPLALVDAKAKATSKMGGTKGGGE